VATLSLGSDMGLGQPMEHVIRQTMIALRMSELLGLDESERAVVYYAGLLAWVGCHTDAYEQAKWFGDDIRVKADGFLVAELGPGWLFGHLGSGRPPLERARLAMAFVGAARRGSIIDLRAHWLAADASTRPSGWQRSAAAPHSTRSWWSCRGQRAGIAARPRYREQLGHGHRGGATARQADPGA
jgi:hypothetical protein